MDGFIGTLQQSAVGETHRLRKVQAGGIQLTAFGRLMQMASRIFAAMFWAISTRSTYVDAVGTLSYCGKLIFLITEMQTWLANQQTCLAIRWRSLTRTTAPFSTFTLIIGIAAFGPPSRSEVVARKQS
jgi:hypothetical protein